MPIDFKKLEGLLNLPQNQFSAVSRFFEDISIDEPLVYIGDGGTAVALLNEKTAYFFTALCCISIPRPAGLSGAVITPPIWNPAFTNASSDATAKSGVPIKTMRKSSGFLPIIAQI